MQQHYYRLAIFQIIISIIFFCHGDAISQPLDISCLTDDNPVDFNSSFIEADSSVNKVILVGEIHGISETYDLYFNLIAFCQRNNRVRYLLSERSYAESLLYNAYLREGDISYLKYDVAWSSEMKAFFEKLYALNLKLPNDRKLTFIGIDAIHSPDAFVYSIKKLLPNKIAPKQIADFIDSVRNVSLPLNHRPSKAREHFSYMDNLLSGLRSEILQNREAYEKFLGDNFTHILAIVNSTSSYSKPGRRNASMFHNFKEITSQQNLKGPYLGLFGNNHVINLKGSDSFGEMLHLSSVSPFKGQVIRMLIHYENSFANFNDRVIEVPSVLQIVLGKRETQFKKIALSQANCENFIIKTFPDLIPDESCQYIFFIRNAKPLKRQ